jgi:hypothetical protein
MHPEKRDSRAHRDALVRKTRLWRNIFAAGAAAMAVQLVFNLGRPGVLIVGGVIVVLLLVAALVAERIVRGALESSDR